MTDKLEQPSWSAIAEFDADYGLGLDGWASAEAQVAALADDIAYNNHDVDDGVQAGLFSLDELADGPADRPDAAPACAPTIPASTTASCAWRPCGG